MIIHKDSHVDHHLTSDQLKHIETRFAERVGFFVETFELPTALGTVPCGLFGPLMGDSPVTDEEASWMKRGAREYPSRVIERRPRRTSKVTVVAGPHEETCGQCAGKGEVSPMAKHENEFPIGAALNWQCPHCDGGKLKHGCILYTAFGGPAAPREMCDPTLPPALLDESKDFWGAHALSCLEG